MEEGLKLVNFRVYESPYALIGLTKAKEHFQVRTDVKKGLSFALSKAMSNFYSDMVKFVSANRPNGSHWSTSGGKVM